MRSVSHGPNGLRMELETGVSWPNAELVAVATFSARLAIGRVLKVTVGMTGRVGGAPSEPQGPHAGAPEADATPIGHAGVLRAERAFRVPGHRVMAPSTLGTFLRAFRPGHVRARRPWSPGC